MPQRHLAIQPVDVTRDFLGMDLSIRARIWLARVLRVSVKSLLKINAPENENESFRDMGRYWLILKHQDWGRALGSDVAELKRLLQEFDDGLASKLSSIEDRELGVLELVTINDIAKSYFERIEIKKSTWSEKEEDRGIKVAIDSFKRILYLIMKKSSYELYKLGDMKYRIEFDERYLGDDSKIESSVGSTKFSQDPSLFLAGIENPADRLEFFDRRYRKLTDSVDDPPTSDLKGLIIGIRLLPSEDRLERLLNMLDVIEILEVPKDQLELLGDAISLLPNLMPEDEDLRPPTPEQIQAVVAIIRLTLKLAASAARTYVESTLIATINAIQAGPQAGLSNAAGFGPMARTALVGLDATEDEKAGIVRWLEETKL